MTAEHDIFIEMKRLAPMGEKVYPLSYREQAIANVLDRYCRKADRQTIVQVV